MLSDLKIYFKRCSIDKKLVWLYFFLLIFEGALRKWVLPFLATPLLIVRDPIAIYIIYLSFKKHYFPWNGYILAAFLYTAVAIGTTLFLGHHNIWVALYGARISLFHFPLIFLIGKIFNKNDVIQLGKVTLLLSIGMIVLVGIQYFSPQSAWVNKGIGDDSEGSGFSGANGFFRVPGTFSFTNGLTLFFGLVAVFILYFWMSNVKSLIPKILLYSGTGSLLLAIPLVMSRGLIASVLIIILISMPIAIYNRKYLFQIIVLLASTTVAFILCYNIPFVKTAADSFLIRFTSASEAEGGVKGTFFNRAIGGIVAGVRADPNHFWGQGLGMGTNAGAKILTGTAGDFLISETEWGRIVGESGILLGMVFIACRLVLSIQLFFNALQVLKKGNILPLLIFGNVGMTIIQAQYAQPTALGFSILGAGLLLGSLNDA